MIVYSDKLTIDDLARATDFVNAVHLADGAHGGFSTGNIRLIEGPKVRKRRIEGVTLRADSRERPKNWRELDGEGVCYANAVDVACGGRAEDRGPDSGYRSPMGGRTMMPQYATYHEHGHWMARVFEMDPDARIKSAVNDFDGREDFHRQTNGLYRIAPQTFTCPDCGRPIERTESGGWWRHVGMPDGCWRLSMDGPFDADGELLATTDDDN
jgi:hypothetical protein